MPAAHTDFARAFTPGTVFRDSKGREDVAEVVDAGELVLPTGRVVACDPAYLQTDGLDRQPPYTRTVTPGRYPLRLSLAHPVARPELSRTVVAAMVWFGDNGPVAWEMALRPGQDPATLPLGHFFGYGVDGGTGCFADARVVELLQPEREEFARRALEPRKVGVVTWDDMLSERTPFFRQPAEGWGRGPSRAGWYVEVLADADGGANLVAFPSGIGDGSYASYWGLDAAGEPCRLVTDFGILLESFDETLSLPIGTREPVYRHPELVARGIVAVYVETEVQATPPPQWPGEPPFDYRLTVVAYTEGPGHLYDTPRLRAGGREYTPRRAGGTRGNGRYNYEYDLDQPLPPDAELLVTYTARTVPL
ncbi:MAG: DUF4241 domain-containing protein [Gemmataceae bacterium]|nr:DUF4241 domain-containing protein [Gemmataceae bacterium]